MLQQTQVERVISFYKKFLKRFPNVQSLASSNLRSVLQNWQGLGYNRRAKMLWETAKRGPIPRAYGDLIELPGVGDYTAKAVRVFAFNEPEIMIETNIRTVFLHHFFPKKKKVIDADLVPYMILSINKKNSREWYWALMDYGAHLKKTVPNPSRRSATHTRQKSFKGSDREIRGAILRAFLTGRFSLPELPFDKKRVRAQFKKLKSEGLVS